MSHVTFVSTSSDAEADLVKTSTVMKTSQKGFDSTAFIGYGAGSSFPLKSAQAQALGSDERPERPSCLRPPLHAVTIVADSAPGEQTTIPLVLAGPTRNDL